MNEDKNMDCVVPFHQELLDKLKRGVTLDGPVAFKKGRDLKSSSVSAYGDNYHVNLGDTMCMEEIYDIQENSEEFYSVQG